MVRGVHDPADRTGRVALLAGNSGVGKSTLALDAIDFARSQGFDVLTIACEPFHEGMSFFPIRELVRQLADGRSVGEAISDSFGPDSPQAEMAAVSESTTADPSSRREALVATFTNAIVGRFTGGDAAPLLLFLDDLEHLDAGSADALICLISRIHEAPVLVMGAFRTDLVNGSGHPLRAVITTARRIEGMLNMITLDRFGNDAVSQLTEVMLGNECELPAAFYDKLARETEGNPLFIREVLRTLRTPDSRGAPGPLRLVDGKWQFSGTIELWAIPASVEEVIATRLDRLDPQQRSELEYAAVVGRRFAFEVLNRLTSMGEDDLLEHLEQFLNFDIIRELDKGDDTFEFSHGKIRDVLYKSMSGLRQRKTHAKVAEVFRQMMGTTNEDWDALIGRHLFEAAKHHEAFPFLLRAARNARDTGSVGEAASLFRLAVTASEGAILTGEDSRQTIQLELANALVQSSETQEAAVLLEQLTRPEVPVEIRSLALNYQADSVLFDGDVDSALAIYRECEVLARAHGQSTVVCEVSCDLAELHGRQYERLAGTDPERAAEHAELHRKYVDEAFRLLDAVESGTLKARVLRNKAKQARVEGDLDTALSLYQRSISSVDGRVGGHRFLIPYAKALRLDGREDEALAVIERILSWSGQVGSRRSEAIAWQYRGMFLMMSAKSEAGLLDARKDLEKALHLHRIIRYAQGLHETELLLAEVDLRLGQQDEALVHLERAIGRAGLSARELLDVAARELSANGELDRSAFLRDLAVAAAC